MTMVVELAETPEQVGAAADGLQMGQLGQDREQVIKVLFSFLAVFHELVADCPKLTLIDSSSPIDPFEPVKLRNSSHL